MITNIIVWHADGRDTSITLCNGLVSVGHPDRGGRPLDLREVRVVARILMALADNYEGV